MWTLKHYVMKKKIYSSLKPYVLSDESSKWKPKAVNKKDN